MLLGEVLLKEACKVAGLDPKVLDTFVAAVKVKRVNVIRCVRENLIVVAALEKELRADTVGEFEKLYVEHLTKEDFRLHAYKAMRGRSHGQYKLTAHELRRNFYRNVAEEVEQQWDEEDYSSVITYADDYAAELQARISELQSELASILR